MLPMLEAKCSNRNIAPGFELKSGSRDVRSVPAGTLDAFCTQFTIVHSSS